ncbi:3-oxoadipate enol-lactonase [Massilia cavernae]|uniref:3-oxoadipate enol-lactonase n=1 Tax=Massilia cavernae TaxID=2320864 RepID=A0A418XR58_9BURK|nr:3-oxoadipate enol-lactonase [Massilia cavernae]RJG14971.1 3-oxoadipate enol-lactonase [Massilia cavernae]
MPQMTLDGASIHFRLDGPATAPVLLLSNSLGTTLDMWEPQVAAFAAHFRVLRYDTRGHGGSTAGAGPYSVAQLGGDVVQLLDHLGIERAHLCGLSMGGITAMWLALNHPGRVGRLVLSNTAAWIGPASNWTERAERVQQEGMAPIAAAVVSRWLTPGYAAEQPEQVEALQAMLRATPRAGYVANCIAVRDNDLRGEVAGIRARTLVIAGSGDIPTPPADGRFLANTIPDCRYVELDAAHLSNQEQPDKFNAAVLEFLAGA